MLVYGIVFGAGLYYIAKLVSRGPDETPPVPEEGEADLRTAHGSSGQPMTPDVLPIILPLVWAAILALAVFLYVLLDGYDLGLGVLFPLAPTHQDRDAMMNSVAPFWDGNETWLVLGGGGLLAAFPLAYAVMMPALYLPHHRHADRAHPARRRLRVPLQVRRLSLDLGPRLRRRLDRRRADAGPDHRRLRAGLHGPEQPICRRRLRLAHAVLRWSPRFAVVAGYVLLSAGWLIMKGDEALRDWAYIVARYALIAVAAFILIFSLWTPLIHPQIARAGSRRPTW